MHTNKKPMAESYSSKLAVYRIEDKQIRDQFINKSVTRKFKNLNIDEQTNKIIDIGHSEGAEDAIILLVEPTEEEQAQQSAMHKKAKENGLIIDRFRFPYFVPYDGTKHIFEYIKIH